MLSPARLTFLFLLGLAPSALAKDLPRAEPVRKANGCEWAGPGFAKAEGSQTCVKVGGGVRAEFTTSSAKTGGFPTTSGN